MNDATPAGPRFEGPACASPHCTRPVDREGLFCCMPCAIAFEAQPSRATPMHTSACSLRMWTTMRSQV